MVCPRIGPARECIFSFTISYVSLLLLLVLFVCTSVMITMITIITISSITVNATDGSPCPSSLRECMFSFMFRFGSWGC